MDLRKAIAISLTLLTCSAQANDLCKLNSAIAEKKIKINGVPGWFFKVHPDGNYITYIESDHNTLLDLKTGAHFPLSGTIDPVWSPDGKFMTHPAREGDQGIQFFHANEILTQTLKGKTKEAKSFNSDLGGVYQSIGLKDGKYKMISDQDGVSILNFDFGKDGPSPTEAVKKPCSNFTFENTDLPMISKDGRFLSIHHISEKRTKIYKLGETECDLALDLGYDTGKVSFNKDSSQIAFHVEQFSDFQNGYFSGVGKDKVLNVMVLNLDETSEGKLIPSSWAVASHHTKPGDGGYYPDYDKFGNIYYMEDINNNFQFVKVNPKKLQFRDLQDDLLFGKKHCVNCDTKAKQGPSTPVILADMWKKACGKEKLLSNELIQAFDPAQCKNMVNKFYVKSLGVSKESLMKTCPVASAQPPVIVGQWNPNQGKNAESLIKGRCIVCHTTPRTFEAEYDMMVQSGPNEMTDVKMKFSKTLPAFNLDKLDPYLAYEMVDALRTDKMPKGDPLPEAQKKLLGTYFQKRLLDMDAAPEDANDYTVIKRYAEPELQKLFHSSIAQNPMMSEKAKDALRITTNCLYGQKNCTEYLQMQRPLVEEEAEKLPFPEREKFKKDKMTELKCQNLIEITPQECLEFDRRKKKK